MVLGLAPSTARTPSVAVLTTLVGHLGQDFHRQPGLVPGSVPEVAPGEAWADVTQLNEATASPVLPGVGLGAGRLWA